MASCRAAYALATPPGHRPGTAVAFNGVVEPGKPLTAWHLLAFVGELVLWGCAAWAGWSFASGPIRWLLGVAGLVAILTVWALWAAPRARRRLALAPRLALIAALGALVAAPFVVAAHWAGAAIVLAATAAIVLAQGMTGREEPA